MRARPLPVWLTRTAVVLASLLGVSSLAWAADAPHGGEASLILPDLDSVLFMGGIPGGRLLVGGIVVCLLGLAFGLVIYRHLKNLPVHKSMLEISDLIYETCKTYLITQGKFILLLEVLIGSIMVVYFGVLRHFDASKVVVILVFSLIGIAGSYGVAWFGIRVNTFANSRTAFASLRGRPYPIYAIPLKAGMSIGMLLISVELVMMLCILLFLPRDYAGSCFIGFAIGESLGASVLRIAGGIFTKIADIGSDLMKIVFNIKEDDARNPGVIADCTGDNAGDSVGPSADGFETYGVTGVALITFILLAVADPTVQVQLLVWIFMMRIMMIVASGLSFLLNEAAVKGRYGNADKMNFEKPLTQLVWVTSLVSVAMTYVVSNLLIPSLGNGGDNTLWWKLSTIITCGTLAGAIIPEVVKVFTSTESAHVREVVTSSREGGASLNILSGLTAGNFSAYWMGIVIVALMGIAYGVSTQGLGEIMKAPAVFSFGLVAFGFLGMGPVTIAVDSYGPVTDNAQSVYELSVIESIPDVKARDQEGPRLRRELRARQAPAGGKRRRREHLQGNGQAGVDRHRGGGRHDHDLLHHHDVDPGADQRAGEPVHAPSPLPAGPGHRRRGHLLVHRRLHPGGVHGRLPRGRVHQGEHQAGRVGPEGQHRRQQEGGGDLHQVRPEGDDQHLPDGVLQHPGLRLPGAVLLHRLPDLHRPVRPLPGHLHGERGRRLGQRQEAGGGGAEGEGHGPARRHGGGRHGGRSLQGHLVGGHEPGHQVHHPVRSAGRGAVGRAHPHHQRHPGRGLLPGLHGIRLAVVLRHAHRHRTDGSRPRSRRREEQQLARRGPSP